MPHVNASPPAYSLEEKFRACVDIIQAMPKKGPVPRTYVEMLSFYALFKQATLGPCTVSQPAFWNVIERYKWDAWKALGDITADEAMERYVSGVLQKVDYCAEHFDWDDMLKTYATDYDRLEPILREKFRIIDRELIKEDGTQLFDDLERPNGEVKPGTTSPLTEASHMMTPPPSEPFNIHLPYEDDPHGTPNDPLSDAEYCDARDVAPETSLSRSSSFSVHDHSMSPSRIRTLRAYCARMDVELRAISSTLIELAASMDNRHQTLLKFIKNSAVYVAVPSRLSWRAVFFFLVWPFIVHWVMRWFGYANGNGAFY